MTTRHSLGLSAAGIAVLAVLAGCSEQQPGSPVAVGTDSATATPPPKTTTSRSTANGGGIDSCSLLSDADATRLGLSTPGKAGRVGGAPGCTWTASGQFVLGISTDTKGVSGLQGESVPLPKHKAVKVANAGGFDGCGVAVEVSDSASVLIALSGGKSGDEMCPRAIEVANIVDSKLP